MAQTYLRISNGTTTITFFDGAGGSTNFAVEGDGWAPSVPGLATNIFGRTEALKPVIESFRITIKGATTDACIANVLSLKALLDDARRAIAGDPIISYVYVEYSPNNSGISSSSSPMRALILGPNSDIEGFLQLPENWELQATTNKQVNGIMLKFVRRTWLHAKSTPQSNASAATNSYEIASVTITPTATHVSPALLRIGDFVNQGAGNVQQFPSGILTWARDSSYYHHFNASSIVNGAGAQSSVADANARGGNYLSFQPASTANQITNVFTLALPTWCRHFAVLASLRSDGNAARTWGIKMALSYNSGLSVSVGDRQYSPTYYFQYPTVTGVNSPVYPRLLFTMSRSSDKWKYAYFQLNADAFASGPELGIGTITLLALRDETVGMFEYTGLDAYRMMDNATVNYRGIFDHRFLTARDPRAGIIQTNDSNFSPFLSQLYDPTIYVQGSSAAFLWLTGGGWRLYNSTPALTSPTYTVITSQSYPVAS